MSSNPVSTVWVSDPLQKIYADTAPPRRRSSVVDLEAARNECECFQICVRPSESIVIESAHCGALESSKGRIPASCVTVRHVEFVPVRYPSAGIPLTDLDRAAPGFYPDPILHEPERFVPAGQTRSLWGTVRIPTSVRPGMYRGTVAIETSSGRLRVSLKVRVRPIRLPRRGTFSMTQWFSASRLADHHRVKMWSKGFWDVLGRYFQNMVQHRQNVILTPLIFGDPDRRLIGVRRERGGRYRFDFRRFDRWVELFLKAGGDRIEGAHLAGRALTFRTRKWPIATNELELELAGGKALRYERTELTIPLPKFYRDVLDAFLPKLAAHLERRGWTKHFLLHISDEPNPRTIEPYLHLLEFVRERVGSRIKLVEAASDPASANALDIPVPRMDFHDRRLDFYSDLSKSGKEVWTYNCNGPRERFPNRYLDQPLIGCRIVPWICWRYGISGYLHWGHNHWSRVRYLPDEKGDLIRHMGTPGYLNPWVDASCEGPITIPPGDPFIVYPPRPAGLDDQNLRYFADVVRPGGWRPGPPTEFDEPVDSIRWEQTREGIEDYEYLSLLAKQIAKARKRGETGEAARAQRVMNRTVLSVARSWTEYTRDPRALMRARAKIADEIERLL